VGGVTFEAVTVSLEPPSLGASDPEDGSESSIDVVDQDPGQAAGLLAEERSVDQFETEWLTPSTSSADTTTHGLRWSRSIQYTEPLATTAQNAPSAPSPGSTPRPSEVCLPAIRRRPPTCCERPMPEWVAA
jgi:hypothetical protein